MRGHPGRREKNGKATSTAAEKAGAGGCYGARTAARERVAGRKENPAGKSYVVGGRGGGVSPT